MRRRALDGLPRQVQLRGTAETVDVRLALASCFLLPASCFLFLLRLFTFDSPRGKSFPTPMTLSRPTEDTNSRNSSKVVDLTSQLLLLLLGHDEDAL